ncbi:zinc finger BED domain-containing protein 5-like [Macrobrachium rosenbergii]|uniref:zinc finger BED domain-containing protein 5-like n=1 Tax=Macrobrachium rosenbergii TaxID=79674 RepID=UPI0034D46A96
MDADNVMKQNLSVTEKQQLTDVSTDLTLKAKYNKEFLLPFWANLLHEYPESVKRALKHLMPFATTYMCEAASSRYIATKNEYRSKLDAAPDTRLLLTNIVPDFDGLFPETSSPIILNKIRILMLSTY